MPEQVSQYQQSQAYFRQDAMPPFLSLPPSHTYINNSTKVPPIQTLPTLGFYSMLNLTSSNIPGLLYLSPAERNILPNCFKLNLVSPIWENVQQSLSLDYPIFHLQLEPNWNLIPDIQKSKDILHHLAPKTTLLDVNCTTEALQDVKWIISEC